MTNGLELTKKKILYGKYLGRWVIISPYNSSDRHGGRIVDITDGEATLNPYYGPLKVDSEKGIIYGIVEDEHGHTVNVSVPLSIREVNE